jgi:hypothetical protein
MHADGLKWGENETVDDGAASAIKGERWHALKWRAGLIPTDSRYEISTHGRLRSPYTKRATRGFWANGTRWAATRNGPLVNLWVAAGLAEQRLAPSLQQALDAFMTGHSPQELADAT